MPVLSIGSDCILGMATLFQRKETSPSRSARCVASQLRCDCGGLRGTVPILQWLVDHARPLLIAIEQAESGNNPVTCDSDHPTEGTQMFLLHRTGPVAWTLGEAPGCGGARAGWLPQDPVHAHGARLRLGVR